MTPTTTPTTFPSTWVVNADGSATAPDGSATGTGDVLTLFHTTFAQVDTLTAQLAALAPPSTGPTQAAFDALSAEVGTLTADVSTITKALDGFAAAVTAAETPATA